MHEDAAIFDSTIAHSDILESSGLNFAVVDPHTSVIAALKTRGQSAQIGEKNEKRKCL